MKMIVASLSWKCTKVPRCSFCYQKNREKKADRWQWLNQIELVTKNNESATVCFEYSGYNFGWLYDWRFNYTKNNKTMTTAPHIITPTFCSAIKKLGIHAVSISYDNEKCSNPNEWKSVATIVKQNGLPVGCNYLIQKIPMDVPQEILTNCDQLNLLVLKPTGELTKREKEILELEIEQYKAVTKVTVDTCLGVQLGIITDCRMGIDFIHINPDGSIEPCCFGSFCFLYKESQ